MKPGLILLLSIFSMTNVSGQELFRNTWASLHGKQADSVYDHLAKINSIPFTSGDSVAFLYKGNAERVTWMGDFNGWGSDPTFPNKGTRLPGTDLWILKSSFPENARLDYKIVVDGQWIQDPANPNYQHSGADGVANSVLRMPLFKAHPVTIRIHASRKGNLQSGQSIQSKNMGYDIAYRVYVPLIPKRFNQVKPLPVLYVTDGSEYADEKLGNMITILDNLIAEKKIEPVVVVFIDQREPANQKNNRRMHELTPNKAYATFLIEELIPEVERNFKVDTGRRGILGTSLGGLTASSLVFTHPQVFRYGGIQSPAYWYWPEIFEQARKLTSKEVRLFITTGTVNDTKKEVEKMKTILTENACTFEFKEVAQGHSWGNWKDLIDDILIYFFPSK